MNHFTDPKWSQLATSAFSGVSMFADRRAKSTLKSYDAALTERLTELKANGCDDLTLQQFRGQYFHYFTAWLTAMSSCYSWFVSGPSGYNSKQAGKRSRSADLRMEEWNKWEYTFFKRLANEQKGNKIAEAGGPVLFELAQAESELTKMETAHQQMKDINKIAKSKKLSIAAKVEAITAEYPAITPTAAESLLVPIRGYSSGFQGFQLTNSNAKIKRLRQRVKDLDEKAFHLDDEEVPEYRFDGGHVILNYEADRVQIFFDEIPPKERRQELCGRHALRFSRRYGNCYQRKLTVNGIRAVEALVGVELPLPGQK